MGKSRRARNSQHQKGAARAKFESGGSFAQLLKAGRWNLSAHRLYPDLRVEEVAAMARELIEAPDNEGPGSQGHRRKRIRYTLSVWDPKLLQGVLSGFGSCFALFVKGAGAYRQSFTRSAQTMDAPDKLRRNKPNRKKDTRPRLQAKISIS